MSLVPFELYGGPFCRETLRHPDDLVAKMGLVHNLDEPLDSPLRPRSQGPPLKILRLCRHEPGPPFILLLWPQGTIRLTPRLNLIFGLEGTNDQGRRIPDQSRTVRSDGC